MLTEERVSGASAIARFVGVEAYEAAGGQVLRKLFADEYENGVWFEDRALLETLAMEKLRAPATAVGLARACGLEPDRARRLLRALAELRLAENMNGEWRATGRGAFLAASHPWTLADAAVEYPKLRVTILDRPEVIERAMCVTQPDRVTFQAGDLFEPWGVEGDAVIFARVLHDWDDGPALRLLHQARRALPSEGRVFAVEMVLSEDGAAGGLCDLHLLAVTGGRERTAAEYAVLLDRAGFAFEGVRRLPGLPSVVVGVRK